MDRGESRQPSGDLIAMAGSLLLTGGSGLLGVNWAVSVRERFSVTLALHRRVISLRGVTSRLLDLRSEDAVVRALEEANCPLMVHTAGLANVEACEAEPERARLANVQLAETVSRACLRSGAMLVHVSTDHLFGAEGGCMVESDPVSPTNVYGRTKAEAEARVLDIMPHALVVRTNFYGWGPPYRSSFSDVIIRSLRAGRTVRLFRDVTYAPILMQPLIRSVHDLVDRGASGIVHVVGDDAVTKHEFGKRLAAKCGLRTDLIVAADIAEQAELVPRPRSMALSNAKATRLLGHPIGGISEHLEELVALEHADQTVEIGQL